MSTYPVLRLASIDLRIRTGAAATAPAMSRDFGVSERQAYRDIDNLRDRYGAPIEPRPGAGGYVYTRTYRLPRLMILEAGRQAEAAWRAGPDTANRYAFARAWKQGTLGTWYGHLVSDLRRPPSHRTRTPDWYCSLSYHELVDDRSNFFVNELMEARKQLQERETSAKSSPWMEERCLFGSHPKDRFHEPEA